MTKLDVSDHAVVRWLERVRGFDIAGLKDEIREAVLPAAAIGASAVERNGAKFAIENGVVVTVMTAKQRKAKRWKEIRQARRAASEFEEIDL